MKRQYDEVMDRIQVTDEMKARILSQLQEIEWQNNAHSKIIRLSARKKYWSAVACVALLLAGAVMLPHLLSESPVVEPPGGVSTVHEITQVNSAEELSELVGFGVADLPCVPFQAAEITYTSYWNELAEIVYQGEEQTATFRKSLGNQDNSGDYNSYAEIRQVDIENMTVTLKGDEEKYVLAVWSDGEYTYSLKMSSGIAQEAWIELIGSVMNKEKF
ncbi:MAG: hypothetical protein ACOX7N_09965 [Lawsonibacter sp.]